MGTKIKSAFKLDTEGKSDNNSPRKEVVCNKCPKVLLVDDDGFNLMAIKGIF